MKLMMFALLDTKVGNYGTPFFMNHPAAVIRALTDLAQDASTTIGRHPADYQLHQLGLWDDDNGAFEREFVNFGTVVSLLPRPGPPVLVQEAV